MVRALLFTMETGSYSFFLCVFSVIMQHFSPSGVSLSFCGLAKWKVRVWSFVWSMGVGHVRQTNFQSIGHPTVITSFIIAS